MSKADLKGEEAIARIQEEEDMLEIIQDNLGSLMKQLELERKTRFIMEIIRLKTSTPRTRLNFRLAVFRFYPNPTKNPTLDTIYFKIADELLEYFQKKEKLTLNL